MSWPVGVDFARSAFLLACVIAVAGAVPCTEDSDCTRGEFVDGSPPGNCEKVWCNIEKGHCARHYLDSTTICRRARGVCDKTEWCTGDAGHCPPDEKSTAVCRFRKAPCDQREYCDGVGDHCPHDALAPPTTVCRPAANDCDEPEFCTGDSLLCPSDQGILSPHCEQEARVKCWSSCGCRSRTACEVAMFRCRWVDGECRPRLDEPTEPNGTETEASRRLAHVLQRRSSISNEDLTRGGKFPPHYGVTVLGTISDGDLSRWANRAYELIKDDDEVTDHLVLLPPRSYHVSVRDLDAFLGRSTSVSHTTELLATFRDLQTELHRIFRGEPVAMRPNTESYSGGIWYFHSANHQTEMKMREAEGLMPGLLGAADANIWLHWHMVFAYPRDGWRESHHSRQAQRRITSIIEKWGLMPTNITFNPPTVLTYEDITLFTPL